MRDPISVYEAAYKAEIFFVINNRKLEQNSVKLNEQIDEHVKCWSSLPSSKRLGIWKGLLQVLGLVFWLHDKVEIAPTAFFVDTRAGVHDHQLAYDLT